MNYLYHSYLDIPLLSFFNAIVLIFGLHYFGYFILKISKFNLIVERYSAANFQNILISYFTIISVFYPFILFFEISFYFLRIISLVLYLLGIIFLIQKIINFKKIKISYVLKFLKSFRQYKSLENIEFLILSLLFIFYLIISLSPVTNADSLDYHLYTAKHIINYSVFPNYLTNFHSTRLSGGGEIFISIGLIVGSEQFGSLVQASGLLTFIGVFKKFKLKKIYLILILCSPVLIFFTTSIKPQLFNICASGFVFSVIFSELNNLKISSKINHLKIVSLISYILYLNIIVKFSFLLGSFLLSIMVTYLGYKRNLFFKTVLIQLVIYIVILFPSILWKYLNFGGNFYELFFNPFDTNLYGLENFKLYLTNLNKGNFWWIFFPQNIKEITHTLGLGSLVIFILFFNWKNINFFILTIIASFFLITHFFAQFSPRFLLEPYIWLILFISIIYKKFIININLKIIFYLQSLITISILFYGIITLFPGNFSAEHRDKVLSKHANGYLAFKWAKNEFEKLNYKGSIISSKRSIGFSNKISIPPEHLYFVDLKKPKAKIYINEIKKLKPKYILISKETNIFSIYKKCLGKKISYAEKLDRLAVRNPLLESSQYYDIEIFEFNFDQLPDCIIEEDKPTYVK